MKLSLSIDLENAAFDYGQATQEVKEILRVTMYRLESFELAPGESYPLHDCNGNRVGSVSIED